MIYGTLQVAMEYTNRGYIEEWLQLFLRGDGKNVAMADGLLLEPRQYWGQWRGQNNGGTNSTEKNAGLYCSRCGYVL